MFQRITKSAFVYPTAFAVRVLFVVFQIVGQCVLNLCVWIEQFADGMIVVQFVDHQSDVFAQVYVDVVWTGQ